MNEIVKSIFKFFKPFFWVMGTICAIHGALGIGGEIFATKAKPALPVEKIKYVFVDVPRHEDDEEDWYGDSEPFDDPDDCRMWGNAR